jgi:flagellar hook assembly protein FlgD
MRIYDRWGNNVFTTDNFNTRWDGKNVKGDTMERGVYSVRVDIIEARGKEKTIYGKAILIQ